MSLANEAYWMYIHNHFKCIATQYGVVSPGSTATSMSSPEDRSSSSTSLFPSPPTVELSNSSNEDRGCGFDFCDGFCAELPDTDSDHEENCLPISYIDEVITIEYWMATQEAQAVTALVNMYIAAPDPQASVDSIPCETDFEMRLWGECTRVLRAKRSGMKAA